MHRLILIGAIMVTNTALATPGSIDIPFDAYSLDNGLQVVLHEDHTTPVVHVEVWYHVGSKDEPMGRSGFAHLFEHLMFNGSEHADGEYFAPLQPYGARINGTTNTDRTNYYETVPSNVLERALWMEADRMGFLLGALGQDKLDNQRDVVRNERRQNYEIAPYAKSRQAIVEALWPEAHPYHRLTIGSHEDIAAATLDDVSNFFNTWYVPNNATIAIVGDIDAAQTKEWVQRYFGPIKKGPQPNPITEVKPQPPKATSITLEDRVQLPRLYYVWQSAPFLKDGDADLDVLSLVLSNGKTSRLHKRLVFDEHIAKDIYAGQWSSQLGSAYYIIATAAPGHTTQELQASIDDELQKLLVEGPTQEEVERAINGWRKSFFGNIESVAGKAGLLQRYNHYLGDPNWVHKDLERYLAITPASVKDWAQKTLKTEHRVTVVVNPQKAEAKHAQRGE